MLLLTPRQPLSQELNAKKAELEKAAADYALLSEQKSKLNEQIIQLQESLDTAEKDVSVRLVS